MNELEQLRQEIANLRAKVDALESRPLVFPAKAGATSKQWQEQTMDEGALVDFVDGRACTSDSDDSALSPDVDPEMWLAATRDRNTVRYVRLTSDPGLSRLKIFGNKTRGGAYRAYLWDTTTTALNVTTAGSIAATSIGSQGSEVVAINLQEIGYNTHDLTAGTPRAAYFWGRKATYKTTDDVDVYEITAIDLENCP